MVKKSADILSKEYSKRRKMETKGIPRRIHLLMLLSLALIITGGILVFLEAADALLIPLFLSFFGLGMAIVTLIMLISFFRGDDNLSREEMTISKRF